MLNAIYELGKLWVNQNEELDEITILLDINKLNKNTKDVLVVNLIKDESGNFSYEKIDQEDFDSSKNMKYLYKSGSPRGTDITPSCLITDPDKTFNNKFFKWFKNNSENPFISKLYDAISKDQELILNDLKEEYANLNIKNTNTLLTLVIKDGNDSKYVGDIDIFKTILKEASEKKYYESGSKKIKDNSLCFLCDEEKEVFGLVSNAVGFAFSTPEKKGNIPGFLLENQWKLLPICGSCALYLEAGKNFIETYLNFEEFGLKYYLIPKFLINPEENFNKILKKLKGFEDEDRLSSKDVVELEDKLNRLVRGMGDVVEFKFMFYNASNSAFDILAYVESVIPSWLNKLFKTQKEIVDCEFFNNDNLKLIFGDKTEEEDVIKVFNKNEKYYPCGKDNWYWKFLRDIFSNFSRKIYLDLVTDVITQKKISFGFLISRVMNVARENWRNQISNNYLIVKSIMLATLFSKLDILNGDFIMDNEDLNLDELLDSSAKKSSFLIGVLVKKLMNIQYSELDSTPFYNKLYGLEIDEKKIKLIYRKAYDKLRQYKRGYANLEAKISENLVKSENNWNLTKDETSYYFLLGMTLYKLYDKNREEGRENE